MDEIIIVKLNRSSKEIEEKTLGIIIWHLKLFKIQRLQLKSSRLYNVVKYIVKWKPMHVTLIIESYVKCKVINIVLTFPWTVAILKICCIL